MVSVKQENRWRKHLHDEALNSERKRHEALCIGLKRPPRAPIPKVRSATASRASVRAWMRAAAEDYDTATALAEGANAALELPAGAMDDECHWVWEEAIKAIPAD